MSNYPIVASHEFDRSWAYKEKRAYVPSTSKSITAVSDAGGGLVQIESADHGLAKDDVITISGTTSYNGEEKVVEIIDKDNFTVEVTFVATETGSWVYLAANQGKLQFQGRTVPDKVDADLEWTIKRVIYDINGNEIKSVFPSKTAPGNPSNLFVFAWSLRSTYFYS